MSIDYLSPNFYLKYILDHNNSFFKIQNVNLVSFYKAIERLIKQQLPVSSLPALKPVTRIPGTYSAPPERAERPRSGHFRGQRRLTPPDQNAARGESGRGYFISKPASGYPKKRRSLPHSGYGQNKGPRTNHNHKQF